MCTRSQSRQNSPQQEASPVIVEPLRIELPFHEDQFQEDPPPGVPMADNQTMAELLQAPTEGYEDAIVIPEIAANNFELKHGANSSIPVVSSEVAELKDLVRALLLEKRTNPQLQFHLLLMLQLKQLSPIVLHAVVLTHTKIIPLLAEMFIETTSKRSGTLPSNTITNPKEELKGITT
nr:reverse transcriptase domain-containing protein [Tanacetum cinerariifolium]